LKDRVRTLHKEILFLIVLSLATVPLFAFTRMMAAANRRMHVRVAEAAHKQGQEELLAGDIASAIEAFRKAATNDHNNPQYRLELARALAIQDNIQEARLTLLQVREAAPENAEINLDLARLAARTGDMRDAVRYYRNALYGIWPEQEMDLRRREVRVELIDFLLEHNENSAALSELLAFSGEIEDTPAAHIKAGRLFLAAGDAARASDQFGRALESDPDNVDALAGAGEAAFRLARYDSARRYLGAAKRKGAQSEQTENLLELTELIRGMDVLAGRTSLEERRRRLILGLTSARARLQQCSQRRDLPEATAAALKGLDAEATAYQPEVTAAKIRRDPELLQGGLDLIYRMETAAGSGICGAPKPVDQALILIAQMHGVPENDPASR
jgi:tetratricopeptide (TPR) repeat protein